MKVWVLSLSLLLFPVVASAQAPCFAMDYSAAAAPRAGWLDDRSDESGVPVMYGSVWTRAHVAQSGPNGQNIYRTRHIGSTSGTGFYLGWKSGVNGPLCGDMVPPQGSSVYVRFRHRFTAATNFRCGTSVSCVNKYLIFGEGCTVSGSRCRAILEMQGARDVAQYRMRLAFDGGESPAVTPFYRPGTWHDVQLELRSGTSPTSNNGCFKIWIDNNNYSSPTATSGCNHVSAPGDASYGWGYVQFGGFMNFGGHATGDVHEWEDTDFEYGMSFDGTWATSGGSGGSSVPASPSNLRLVGQ